MSDLELEPASFRDPASTVAYLDGRVLRGLTKEGAADYDILAAAPFFAKAMDDGKLVRTAQVPVEDLPQSVRGDAWVRALEHERIPFVSYPYEWTFSMLKDAALVHLDLLLAGLDAELTMKAGRASPGPATASSARRCSTRCCSRPTRTSASSPGCVGPSRASTPRTWPSCSAAPTR